MKKLANKSTALVKSSSNPPAPFKLATPGHLPEPDLAKKNTRTSYDSRRRRAIEETCQKLHSIDYHVLCLEEYPSDHALQVALHVRMVWLLGGFVFASVLALTLLGYTPAWVGGLCGATAFILALLYRTNLLPDLPTAHSYLELMDDRRRIVREVRQYIAKIEGPDGYIHKLLPLAEFNPNLDSIEFRKICALSSQMKLHEYTHSLQILHLYHQFLEESLQAERLMMEVEKESEETS